MAPDPALDRYRDILLSFKQLVWSSSGNGSALCPAHEDRHKSLSVRLGRDGQLVVKCHAKHGCTAEAIAAAVGVTMKDFFPPKENERKPPDRRITHTFEYIDVGGEVMYRAIRTADKSFWQERQDPNTGKWLKGLGDVKRIPWHLPELAGANAERTVFIVEGELKVLALEGLGLLATCNAGGSENWPAWWGDYFRGRHVVILPDHDEAGWKHAALVASTLHPHCRTLRIVELPGLRLKDDVVDWLARFPDDRELKRRSLFAAVEHAPLYDPSDSQLRLATFRMLVARSIAMSCLG
jgi:putative DNA primase/helicase